MNNPYIVLPIILQLVAAVVLMFFWTKTKAQKVLSIIFSVAAVLVAAYLLVEVWHSGILITQSGNWKAPFGITFVADLLGVTLVLVSSIAALGVSIFSAGSMREERLKFGYYPVFHFLVMGLQGAFLTGDIFNLYVWFEVIIISSFVLMTLGGKKAQLEGAIKYVSLNLLASSLFLIGIGFLYGLTGTLNMADLSIKIKEIQNIGLVNVTGGLFLVAFGIKSAIFPMYFWLPASYHTPPPAVTAIFGGLLTKVGVYAMLRTFSLIFGGDEFMTVTISIIAALTILGGAFGAMSHRHMSKIFGYLIISHIGFMMVGISIFTEIALLGTIFYLIHDIIVKTNLFMVSGLVLKINGTQDIKDLGGLYKSYPLLSLLMAIPLFSLVGIPPLSGFWAKIFFVEGALEAGDYLLVISVILGSFLTLWIIGKVWTEVFWKKGENLPKQANGVYFDELPPIGKWSMVFPMLLLSFVSLYIGLGAKHVISLSQKIATELVDPSSYIQVVLQNQVP
ncbi:proton-conducting transporter transmembrane domain-containing protein [Cecembia lonarensis]|uniref:Multiple resistance and pH homeostasis protein D n=1 Tax=Cecembia lonarensis (strain CCUG 58316 / KCTC 22772 / LW9) TaxID=1225176 RepID=K1LUP9_CECL9|nr:proton-conducting transporter membrane subunit [Cecembia lonarensis]EKB47854.1 Multiple resistance and pH homeostasis protein D [Cecembia lonarensis LW9]